MGSGCANTVSSKNSCTQLVSAGCVIYEGDSVPILGICCGDTISEVEEAIINKLVAVLDGTGILLSNVTLENAPFLKNLLNGKDKTLLNMIQLLVDSDTNLRALVAALQAQLTPSGDNYQFDLGCLESEDDITTRDQITQLLITKVCSLQTIVQNLIDAGTDDGIDTSVIVSSIGNYILANISTPSGTGLIKTGTGGTAKISIIGMPPPKSAIPYWGPLSYFDADGKGITGSPCDGWHQLNGKDGYPDWRGYTFAMATSGVPGGNLDARVDATALNLPLAVSTYGSKKGELAHKVTIPELPAHTHILDEGEGHDHPSFYHPFRRDVKGGGNADIIFEDQDKTYNRTNAQDPGKPFVGKAKTGITMASVGGNQPVNIIQPTVYGVWISRID